MSAEEEVWCECSDDEKYNPAGYKKGTWEPKPEDILRIFEEIKTKKGLELQWKCPGRRSPDSDKKTKEDVMEEPKEEEKEEEKKPEVTQFDFDEDGSEPKTVLTPRRTPGSAPKSEKKVARMDKIFKDMMVRRKLQAAEKEARKLALAKSPRTPGSPARARMGSPAGSPRTPPIYGSSAMSPSARAPGPGEGLVTTPLRAPVSEDIGLRTTYSETISDVASTAESAVSRELISKEAVTKSDSSGTVTPPVRNILAEEANLETSKSAEMSVSSKTPPVVSSAVTSSCTPMTSSMTSSMKSESPVPSVEQISRTATPVSETVTQIPVTGAATPMNQDKKDDIESATNMDTS